MVGLQATALKNKLKAKLNGIVNYETWVPSPKMMAPAADFFKKYQARAPGQGIDPLGYYLGGWGYAYMQVLATAITGTKSIDDDKIADYLRSNAFNTIMVDGINSARTANGPNPADAGAVSRHHRCREPRHLERHELSDRAYAAGRGYRQRHLSLRQGVGS